MHPAPTDLLTAGAHLPVPGEDRPAFVSPSTALALLRHDYAWGALHLGERVSKALVAAGWAEPTYRGHQATTGFLASQQMAAR